MSTVSWRSCLTSATFTTHLPKPFSIGSKLQICRRSRVTTSLLAVPLSHPERRLLPPRLTSKKNSAASLDFVSSLLIEPSREWCETCLSDGRGLSTKGTPLTLCKQERIGTLTLPRSRAEICCPGGLTECLPNLSRQGSFKKKSHCKTLGKGVSSRRPSSAA